MAEVVEVNNPEQLEHYHLVWNALLRETRSASFFQSLEWLQAYWRHYGAAQRLRVLVVYSGGAAIGIVPLTVLRDRTRLGSVRMLTYPLHEWGSYYGPIGPNPAATLTAAMRHLRAAPRDWDLLDLRWVDKPGVDRGRTRLALESAGFLVGESIWKEIPLIEMDGDWDAYFASRTSKFRNNLRRAERSAAELGPVSLERHRPASLASGDGDPRWDLYDLCEQVAERSWQAAATDGTTICHDEIRPFLRDLHESASRAGAVDMNVLWIGGDAAAFSYNYHYQGHVSGLRAGFDEAFSRVAPGNVLYHRMFRDSFERGDRLFDLGPGSLEAKRPWITCTSYSYRYRHYPLAAPRIQLLRMRHWLADRRPVVS
jgi:CelD/BcsL family acetyltransferase involved in cellulose biosynthesis